MKKLIVLGLFALLVESSALAQRSSNAPCSRGATRAEIELVRISHFYLCGSPIEATFIARVVHRISGPQRSGEFVGVMTCPDGAFQPGYRFEGCIGEPRPGVPFRRLDDFPHDPRPRLYTETVEWLTRSHR